MAPEKKLYGACVPSQEALKRLRASRLTQCVRVRVRVGTPGAAAAHHGDQGVKGAGGNGGGGGGGERVGDNTDAQTEGECTAVYSLEPLTDVGPTVSAAPGSGAAEA